MYVSFDYNKSNSRQRSLAIMKCFTGLLADMKSNTLPQLFMLAKHAHGSYATVLSSLSEGVSYFPFSSLFESKTGEEKVLKGLGGRGDLRRS